MSKSNLQNKLLEISPGLVTWLLLISPLILGIIYPDLVVFMLTFLTIYWAYKIMLGMYSILRGYKKYKNEVSINWYKKLISLDYKALPNNKTKPTSLEDIRHFVLIPVYSEPEEIIKEGLKRIKDSSIPTNQFVIVYAIEERHHKRVIEDIKTIQKQLDPKKQMKIMYFVHPQNIEGEVMGVAGPNRDWAARRAVEQLKQAGVNLDNYIFTTLDADARVHKHFFARLTYLYLVTENRKNKFYETAVHVFDNNTWRVPIVNRIAADSITIALLSSWSSLDLPITTEQMDTFSCYSCALTTLIKADFWDPSLGIDDSVFYWRAYKALQGDFEGVPFFIPLRLDAAEGSGYVNSHISLYKQQLRWGWGIITFPMAFLAVPKAKKASIFEKISHMWIKIEHFVILRVLAFLLTFGFVMLSFVNPVYTQGNYAYTIPGISSVLLTVTLAGLVPVYIVRRNLKKPMPTRWPLYKKVFLTLLEFPILYVNFLTFGFVPWLEAQTKLMLGKKYKSLYYTPKFR